MDIYNTAVYFITCEILNNIKYIIWMAGKYVCTSIEFSLYCSLQEKYIEKCFHCRQLPYQLSMFDVKT
jgi:hypothetical protein